MHPSPSAPRAHLRAADAAAYTREFRQTAVTRTRRAPRARPWLRAFARRILRARQGVRSQ